MTIVTNDAIVSAEEIKGIDAQTCTNEQLFAALHFLYAATVNNGIVPEGIQGITEPADHANESSNANCTMGISFPKEGEEDGITVSAFPINRNEMTGSQSNTSKNLLGAGIFLGQLSAFAGGDARCVVVSGDDDGNPPRTAIEFDSKKALVAAINSCAESMKYPVKVWNKTQQIYKPAIEWLTRINYDFPRKGEPMRVISGSTISHASRPLLPGSLNQIIY